MSRLRRSTSLAISKGVFLSLLLNDLAPPSTRIFAISSSLQAAVQCNSLIQRFQCREVEKLSADEIRVAILRVDDVDNFRHDLDHLSKFTYASGHDEILASLPSLTHL